MIGGGAAPPREHQITWLVDHRDPAISVVVDVRDAQGSHEFTFRCTTDGRECVNELPQLSEVRRMSAAWDGAVLVMSQRASTPHGDFTTRDRLSLADSAQRLVFEWTVINERGERPVRQVFRKLGPHPSQRAAPEPLPSVELPAELARVVRDYERHWREGNAQVSCGCSLKMDSWPVVAGGFVGGTVSSNRFKLRRATCDSERWRTRRTTGSVT